MIRNFDVIVLVFLFIVLGLLSIILKIKIAEEAAVERTKFEMTFGISPPVESVEPDADVVRRPIVFQKLRGLQQVVADSRTILFMESFTNKTEIAKQVRDAETIYSNALYSAWSMGFTNVAAEFGFANPCSCH